MLKEYFKGETRLRLDGDWVEQAAENNKSNNNKRKACGKDSLGCESEIA